MDISSLKLILPTQYLVAQEGIKSFEILVHNLMNQKQMPEDPWPNTYIELFLHYLSSIDSNNMLNKTSMGEREGRIISDIVSKRYYSMGHGIGRSGDLTEIQPKALGSSILVSLCHSLALSSIRTCGLKNIKKAAVLPVATGMALTLCLLHFKRTFNKKYVIFSRIDQKTCLKCIWTSAFPAIIIDMLAFEENLVSDVKGINMKIEELGKDNIACVISTTSCFAPRSCDNVVEISKLCLKYGIPHIINNAYGLQSPQILKEIDKAIQIGGVDIIVSSLDKNFMVPVGGSVIYSNNKEIVKNIADSYPGRASVSSYLDLVTTLLSLGKSGLISLIDERIKLYEHTKLEVEKVINPLKSKLLLGKNNDISMAISLSFLNLSNYTKLGSFLYKKRVFGTRVVSDTPKDICGYHLESYGASKSKYSQLPYLAFAVAMGSKKDDINKMINRFKEVLIELNSGNEKLTKEPQKVEEKKKESQKVENKLENSTISLSTQDDQTLNNNQK